MTKSCVSCEYGRPVKIWIEQFGPKDEYCYCAHPDTCKDHSLYTKKQEGKKWGFRRKNREGEYGDRN